MNIRRILIPIDYSAYSLAALRFGLELAGKLGATVDVVHVWDRPSYVAAALLAPTQKQLERPLPELIEQQAEQDLREFLAKAELSAPVAGRLLAGEPKAAILEELKTGRHDLLVLGTHGRTGLSHLVLGSVAETLTRLSPVPVLTVPVAPRDRPVQA